MFCQPEQTLQRWCSGIISKTLTGVPHDKMTTEATVCHILPLGKMWGTKAISWEALCPLSRLLMSIRTRVSQVTCDTRRERKRKGRRAAPGAGDSSSVNILTSRRSCHSQVMGLADIQGPPMIEGCRDGCFIVLLDLNEQRYITAV